MTLSRRRFLQATAATTAALTLGPSRWNWAVEGSPFGPLQDDPLLRLPEGFSYKVIAEGGDLLRRGRGPAPRPPFPDLNVTFPEGDGKILLCTSHEVPSEFPLTRPPPEEEYDAAAGGAVTSLLLRRDLTIAQSAYNAGGMLRNCSGGRTPWGTVLTGEETTATKEEPHGFIWEVDPHKHTKVRLDACGRFEHEAALIDKEAGFVYLTEDSDNDSLLYRMNPKDPRDLSRGGVLAAYKAPGEWVRIGDPTGAEGVSPPAQGAAKGALKFRRLEGMRRRNRWLYFTETEDPTACGKVWRLHLDTKRLELWAQGDTGADLCMPDNVVFDAAGNMFVCEDKSNATRANQNRIIFIDHDTGRMSTFAELAAPQSGDSDEPTGPCFDPNRRILFLNLQKADGGGKTLGIRGPFARPRRSREPAAAPMGAQPEEALVLNGHQRLLASLGMTAGEAAALVSLRRRDRIDEIHPELEAIARDLGTPQDVPDPNRRRPRVF